MATHIPFGLEVVPIQSPKDLTPVYDSECIAAG